MEQFGELGLKEPLSMFCSHGEANCPPVTQMNNGPTPLQYCALVLKNVCLSKRAAGMHSFCNRLNFNKLFMTMQQKNNG